jgi:hypothetical protein
MMSPLMLISLGILLYEEHAGNDFPGSIPSARERSTGCYATPIFPISALEK